MAKKITKTSSIGDYIRDMEESYHSTLPPHHIGMNIVYAFCSAYSNKPAPKVNPSPNHKKSVVISMHTRLRKLWLGLRFSTYDTETPLPTDPYMNPTEENLEGTIELLREARGQNFFTDIRDAAVEASDEYYHNAKIPYSDSWRIYDLMHTKLLQKVVRASSDLEKEIDAR
ncbi:MAG: hypothetical protein ABIA62_01055 [Candidatus Woesearchaeota archaeon]